MDAVNTTSGTAGTVVKHPGILYPVMLVAAIAVIVFSVAGIATMMGWMPSALSSSAEPVRAQPVPASKQVRPRVVTAATGCRDCGVVELMRVVEAPGEGSGLGAGAYAGHEIEKNARKSVSYEIRVRMNDGTSRTLYEHALPALTIGQKVRVTDQGLVAAG